MFRRKIFNGLIYHVDVSKNGQEITFASSATYPDSIWKANIDGSGPVKLTEDDISGSFPSWSPDGEKIIFLKNGGVIEMMNADGSNRVSLTDRGAICPEWSPDGRWVAYLTTGEITLLNPSNPHEEKKLISGGCPQWSPDSKWIAFYDSDRGGNMDNRCEWRKLETGYFDRKCLGAFLATYGYIFNTRHGIDQSEQSRPVITNVNLREDTDSGSLIIYKDFEFFDPDGDANRIEYELISTTNDDIYINNGDIYIPENEQKMAQLLLEHGSAAIMLIRLSFK